MKRRRGIRLAGAGLLLALAVAWVAANDDYASSVIAVVPGPQSSSSPDAALGAPSGQGLYQGSGETYTLGVGGSVTLALASTMYDDAGTDLIVCENPFYVVNTATAFIEALYVEVSSDGTHFARFPTHYVGAVGPFPPTVGITPTWFKGFAGVQPVSANPDLGVDPLDVVAAGGDAFDLADLADHPDVVSGLVSLQQIDYVRLVDVHSGAAVDSAGTIVWDCGLDDFASAEVDALVAVHNVNNGTGGQPRVELSLVNGFLTIRIEDDNGFNDVKAGLTASVNGFGISFYALLPFFAITDLSPLGVTLVTGPIPPGVLPAILKVGAHDQLQLHGGDAVTIQ